MPPVGFEPTIPAGERSKTFALDGAATGTGRYVASIRGDVYANRFSGGQLARKEKLAKPVRIFEDNIKMDLKQIR